MRVIVVTPSLNKSFKFQSDWPYNNSQVYLLSSIVDDLKSDDKMEFKDTKNQYVYTSLVNYPNNKSLVKQNVYINKNGKINKVEVVDKDGNAQIIMNFKKEKFNKKFDKDYFELSSVLKIDNNNSVENEDNKKEDNSDSGNKKVEDNKKEENSDSGNKQVEDNKKEDNTNSNNTSATNDNNSNTSNEEEKTKNTASISDIVYPMYLPNNTYLTSQERVNTDNGERLILTFDGDSSFVLIEESSVYDKEGLILPVSGNIDFVTDVLAVVSDNSITWSNGGIDYYMASDNLESSELLQIARSISSLPVSK